MSDASRPRGFHHLAIQVGDLAAMERFYGGTLGLPVLRRWPAGAGDAAGGDRSVWLDAGEGGFIALERIAGAPAPTRAEEDATRPGLHLVALRIDRGARDAWERRLASAGFAVEARTRFTLYVRDPEGNRVGLSHWPDEATG